MITKQQLGGGLIALGAMIVLALIINDLSGTSEFGGIGPLQRNLYITAVIIALVGTTLLPLGDKPA